MKTENIFKFVAIRPPKKKNEEESFIVKHDNSAFEKMIEDTGMQKSEVAEEVMKSSQYFSRIEELQPLLRKEYNLKFFIKESKQKAKAIKDIPGFVLSTVNVLHSMVPAFDLSQFIQSDRYEEIKTQLWNSLYSIYILRFENPPDKDRIVFWIRAFQLFDSIKSGDTQLFFNRLIHFDQMTPAVPKAYIFNGQPLEKATPPPKAPVAKKSLEDTRREQIAKVQNEIESLRNAKIKLLATYEQKQQKLKEQQATSLKKVELKETEKTDVPPVQQQEAPWIMTKKDLEGTQDVFAMLETHNIRVINSSVFDTISKIEQAIAIKISELDDLQHIEDIKVVQGVLVKYRRKIF